MVNIQEKGSFGRRTAYALMGAGLHNGNGRQQSVCGKLWSTYVVPSLLYGLEVFDVRRTGITALEQYHRKSSNKYTLFPIKPILLMCLALPAVLAILPLERDIHKNILDLLGAKLYLKALKKILLCTI